MAQAPVVSQYDPYNQSTQQIQQVQPQSQQHPQQMNPEPDTIRNLMVNYIPTTVDEVQLRQLFERCGPIESVKIVCDRESRQSRGYGFVKFQSASSAQQAISTLNGFTILNKRLKVALAANGHQRGGGNASHMGENFGMYNGYGGYGAYPAANPYAQQQMMAMYQQYMVHQQQPQQPSQQPSQQAQPQPQQPQQQAPPQGSNRTARK